MERCSQQQENNRYIVMDLYLCEKGKVKANIVNDLKGIIK